MEANDVEIHLSKVVDQVIDGVWNHITELLRRNGYKDAADFLSETHYDPNYKENND